MINVNNALVKIDFRSAILRIGVAAWCACTCLSLWFSKADALTVIRLGGEELPPPSAAEFSTEEGSFEFRQLLWESFDQDEFGTSNLMELQPGFVRPQSLDPEVNITPLIRERGGTIKFNDGYGWKDEKQLDFLFDDDETTPYSGEARGNLAPCARRTDGGGGIKEALGGTPDIQCRYIKFDFGGAFIIDRVRFFPTERRRDTLFPKSFRIGTNDGNHLENGNREIKLTWRGKKFTDWNVIVDRLENFDPIVEVALPPDPVKELILEAITGKWEMAEFQIFGSGFAPFASYTSSIINLAGPAVLGTITWSGKEESGAQVNLTARSGDTADPNTYWRNTFRGEERSRFDAAGKELDRTAYMKLEGGEKGGVTQNKQTWQGWSPFFLFSENESNLTASKPRNFVQIKADFHSKPGEGGSRLDFVQFSMTQPPMADKVIAEIAPTIADAGVLTHFTYKIVPQISQGNSGFDRIEIHTPVASEVEEVRISGVPVAWDLISQSNTGISISIPRVDETRSGELLEVDFHSAVFRFGTVFSGTVADSNRPNEVNQPVTPGDADELVEGDGLSVALAGIDQRSIGDLRLSSTVLTPNGDLVNDELLIEYDLINVEETESGSLTLELYNMAGVRIALIHQISASSGRSSVVWNGKTGANLVSPGIYVLRLAVNTDRAVDEVLQPFSIAY